MPIITLGESNYAGLIPADTILPARVTGCALKKTPFLDEKTGAEVFQYEFSFQVEDPGETFDGQRLWGKTSTNFVSAPNCKLYSWSQEILATEFEVGTEVDTDYLVGNECRIVVGVRTWDKNGVTQERNFVSDVMRAKVGAVYAAADDDAPF